MLAVLWKERRMGSEQRTNGTSESLVFPVSMWQTLLKAPLLLSLPQQMKQSFSSLRTPWQNRQDVTRDGGNCGLFMRQFCMNLFC